MLAWHSDWYAEAAWPAFDNAATAADGAAATAAIRSIANSQWLTRGMFAIWRFQGNLSGFLIWSSTFQSENIEYSTNKVGVKLEMNGLFNF